MVITGVIRPPPDIRVVADRTASYVAKNGRAFEARILQSAKGKTPKFAFLQPTSPFHAYYEERIKFCENGGEDGEDQKTETKKEEESKTVEKKSIKDAVRKKEKNQKASAIDPIARALLTQRGKIAQAKSKQKEETKNGDDSSKEQTSILSVPSPPPLELVTIVAPSTLSASQIETIQLVAHFAALEGKGGDFLHKLTLREWNNHEFSFCQPRHAHFAYFSALVDAYRRILEVWTSSSDSPMASKGAYEALEEAAYRAEYEREIEQQKSQQEDGEVVAIDWHDFVVVETIDFPVNEIVELSMLPPPPPPQSSSVANPLVAEASAKEGVDDEEEEETIRVVPSYTPKVVGPARPQEARAIDPITGKSVSVADMPEHMRIQLLDPKWAEERKKFQEKQKDSNLVGGDAIVTNISRFAKARGDLFGKSEQDLLNKERDSKRRLEEANRIIREQAFDQSIGTAPPLSAAVGPSLPIATNTTVQGQLGEPSAKRLRVDKYHIPPPPPPMLQTDRLSQTGTLNPNPHFAPGIEANTTVDQTMEDSLPTSMNDSDQTENDKVLSEAEFAASLSKPEVTLQIRIPNDPSQMAWNFYGQILSMTINVMTKVKDVKKELSRSHLNGMPSNKIQFKDAKGGFLNNNMSLASLNIGPTATLEMIPRTRGGR